MGVRDPARPTGGADPLATTARIAALSALAWAAIIVETAPMRGVVKPDLLFCAVAIWAMARPAATPLALVLAVGLARDLLADAPAGAGALGLLLAAAVLRANAPALAARGFPARAAAAAGALALATLTPCALLTLTLAPAPSALDIATRIIATAIAFVALYPLLRRRSVIGAARREATA